MFVILPRGNEVLGAGIATMLSNFISLAYFIIIFRKVRNESVLKVSFKPVRLAKEHMKSLYMVGVPAAVSIFLFDLITIVLNKLVSGYLDHITPVAAIGIVLKLERIPINVGLGVCLGMVPLVAYNYGARNFKRMDQIVVLAAKVIIIFSAVCSVLFFILAKPFVGIFVKDMLTVNLGTGYLKMRCFALPFMMVGYYVVNYMNAVNKGKISFLLAILRHVVLIIPIMLLMNYIWGIYGLMLSQLVADILNAVISVVIKHVIVSRERRS